MPKKFFIPQALVLVVGVFYASHSWGWDIRQNCRLILPKLIQRTVTKYSDWDRLPMGRWQLYVLRHEGFKIDPAYGQKMDAAVSQVVREAKKNPNLSIFDRSKIIAVFQQPFGGGYGEKNSAALTTYMYDPRYRSWARRLLEKNTGKKVGKVKHEVTHDAKVEGKINGRPIPLGSWILNESPDHPNNPLGLYLHCDADQQAAIIEHCEALHAQAKRPGIGDKEQVALIARIHWWYANMAYWNRGSAGNADALAKSLFTEFGYAVHPWKPEIVPDLEALGLNAEDEFVDKYVSFFESPPVRTTQ